MGSQRDNVGLTNLKIKSNEYTNMLISGLITKAALELARGMCHEGVTTKEIDKEVEQYIRRAGGTPSCLGYHGFPGSICISLNSTIAHQPPSESVILKSGDLVKLDTVVSFEGAHTDSAISVVVPGAPNSVGEHLINVTQTALELMIAAIDPTKTIGEVVKIGREFVEGMGCTMANQIGGHRIGEEMHMRPYIQNDGQGLDNDVLFEVDKYYAIEPLVFIGDRKKDNLVVGKDNTSLISPFGDLGAHFEHTILVTEEGIEQIT